ncbi:flippase-like domain-containing protein, partial [Halorubrum ezzemoulense]
MEGPQRRALILGAGGAVLLLAVLFVVVGVDRVVDALVRADPALVAAAAGLGLCWLAAWSLMLRAVLGALDVEMSVPTAFLVYSGAAFANNVTPFGQAGGEPVAAALISKVGEARYETGLVGIASVDVLNVVPSVSLVFLGVGSYAATTAV